MFLLQYSSWLVKKRIFCFRLLYSEICSYSQCYFIVYGNELRFRLLYSEICSYFKIKFIFITVISVFVSYIRRYVLTFNMKNNNIKKTLSVFVSYIRRYVLTNQMLLIVSTRSSVFVSYIRRYVLTFVHVYS